MSGFADDDEGEEFKAPAPGKFKLYRTSSISFCVALSNPSLNSYEFDLICLLPLTVAVSGKGGEEEDDGDFAGGGDDDSSGDDSGDR